MGFIGTPLGLGLTPGLVLLPVDAGQLLQVKFFNADG
jgi:hypothetical protein